MSKEFHYKIQYEIDNETKQVMAVIPELNHLSSFGDSFAEAEANIREAVLGYLETLMKTKQQIPEPAFSTDGTYLKLFVPTLELV